MFDFSEVKLPDYTRLEDTLNSVTHAIGIPFSVFSVVMLFLKLGGTGSAMQKTAVVVYCLAMLILYAGSAVYHGLKPGIHKQIARVLDHANIFIMIAGTLTAFYLLGVMNYKPALAAALLAFSWLIAAVGIFLTFMNQEKFKKIQMVMYLLLGWTAVIGFKSVYDSGISGRHAVMLVFIGGMAYTLGAVFYGIGKRHRYIHAVFHIFILAGTVLQFVGIYRHML